MNDIAKKTKIKNTNPAHIEHLAGVNIIRKLQSLTAGQRKRVLERIAETTFEETPVPVDPRQDDLAYGEGA